MSETTFRVIGPGGGNLNSADGTMTLHVAPGTLDREREIRIEMLRGELLPPGLVSAVYRIQPANLEVSGGAHATLASDEWHARADQELVLADVTGAEPAALAGSTFDRASETITAPLARFSRFAVLLRPTTVCTGSCLDGGTGGDPDGGVVVDWIDGGSGGPDGGVTVSDGGEVRFFIYENEPNDEQTSAQYLGPSGSEIYTVLANGSPSDEDWFSFEVPLGALIDFRGVTHTHQTALGGCEGIDTVLSLYQGDTAIAVDDDFLGFGPCSEINWAAYPTAHALSPGIYHLHVRNKNPGRPYNLTLQFQPANIFGDGGM